MPVPSDRLTSLGVIDESTWLPELQAARDRFQRAAERRHALDAMSAELIRLRNARVQSCHL